MKMYEYKVEKITDNSNSKFNEEIRNDMIKKLNALGRAGWELCAADNDKLYFKKEI